MAQRVRTSARNVANIAMRAACTILERVSMENFTVKPVDLQHINFNPDLQIPDPKEMVVFYEAKNKSVIGRMTLMLINITGEMKHESLPDKLQICANYASIISLTFKELQQPCKDALAMLGAKCMICTEEDISHALPDDDDLDIVSIVAIVAQLFFLLFKDITSQNYEQFIKNRMSAIKALVGISGHIFEGEVNTDTVFDLEKAKIVRIKLGASSILRKSVLYAILHMRASQTPPLNFVFAYVAEILEWTEMSALVFIIRELLLRNSPVISDIRVYNEVKNLEKAMTLINSCPYPQFFRILNPPHKCFLLNRNNFKTMLAVVQCLKNDEGDPARQFRIVTEAPSKTVLDLARIHRDFIGFEGTVKNKREVDFLKIFKDEIERPEGSEEEEEEMAAAAPIDLAAPAEAFAAARR